MNGNRAMKRFRLFRSKAFWFGVPGLVGLLWGWWVSMGHISTAAVGQTRYWRIAQSAGEVLVSWDMSGLPDDLEVVGKHFDASPEASIDWRRTLKSSDEMFPASKRVGISYHQIVAGCTQSMACGPKKGTPLSGCLG
jgi:hypothetical protein